MLCSVELTIAKTHIKLNPAHLGIGIRSALVLPEVSHEDDVLYIESHVGISGILITVKDNSTGCVVYENTTDVPCGIETSYFMNLEKGSYELTLTIGDKCFIGEFNIYAV